MNGQIETKMKSWSAPDTLEHYLRELFGQSRESNLFDDKLRDVMLRYENTSGETNIREEISKLDDAGFNHVRDPEQLLSTLLVFARPHVAYNGYLENFKAALEYTKKQLMRPLNDLRPFKFYLRDDDWEMSVSNPKGHPGMSRYDRGIQNKIQYLENTDREAWREVLSDASKVGSFNRPIIPGCRMQAKAKYDDDGNIVEVKRKTRLISMVDVDVILAETIFQRPIQEGLKYFDSYSPGLTDVKLRSKILQDRRKFDYWLSIDYSKFDQTIPGWLISIVFDLLFSFFAKGYTTDEDVDVMNMVKHDFIVKKFAFWENDQVKLMHAVDGIPSGSMFTNIVGSICNYLMVNTYMAKIGRLGQVHLNICGDDNLIFSDFKVDIDELSSYLNKVFGVEINAEKCSHGTASDDPEYLSRFWTENRQEYRDPKELIKTALYPERFRDYSKETMPEDVLFALIYTYYAGMEELIRCGDFFNDYHNLRPGASVDSPVFLMAALKASPKAYFNAMKAANVYY